MRSKVVEKQIKKNRQSCLKLARKLVKEQRVKQAMLDIKEHFKDKKAWPLNYLFYLEETGLIPVMFNAVLETSGYKIEYDESSLDFLIRKKK